MNTLSPVELHKGIYFKRDDLFKIGKANGGKLRQVLSLLEKNRKLAREGVMTATSIHSPQSVLVSEACKHLGFKCFIGFGGTTPKRLKELRMPSIASEYADIKIIAKTGRHNVLFAKLLKRQKKQGGFVVRYGVNLEGDRDCFIESIASQVSNLPKKLDNLILVCGSGITTIGVFIGLKKYNVEVKNIYLVGTAPNRTTKIKNNLKIMGDLYGLKDLESTPFNYIDLFGQKGFVYEKGEKASWDGIDFHPNYEAKAFNWFIKNKYAEGEKTLFWIVGGKI